MNDTNNYISLRQGQQFNKYQTKVKEGFDNPPTSILQESTYNTQILEEENIRNNIIENIDSREINELTNLQNNYKKVMNEITLLQKEINDEQKNITNRVSSKNRYLNKNIRINDTLGQDVFPSNIQGLGYVTNKGVFKSYDDSDVYNSTIGKNGCPSRNNQINNVRLDNYSSSLKEGTNMIKGQSCGNEGQNIYTSRLVNNVQSTYIGCYNDRTSPVIIKVVPKMTSSNNVSGFTASASSVYQNNNKFGPWCAFDQNIRTFWHSNTTYNRDTGIYTGTRGLTINTIKSGIKEIQGEYLQINMSSIKVTSYDIQGRQDCCGNPNGRNPNTWYIIGYKNNQWYELDYRSSENYDKELKNYLISNPDNYDRYAILITAVGNSSAPKGTRNSVQISIWNLYSTTIDSNEESAMIFNRDIIGTTSFNDCQNYALENGYKYFGMRQPQRNNNAACLVSNDLTQIKLYGNGSKQLTELPLWSSNTGGSNATSLQLLETGQLALMDTNNNVVRSISNAQKTCINDGKIEITSATYGGNCHKSNVSIGNVTNKVANNLKCNNNVSCSIPISNDTFGDPASGCGKSFNVSYKCGNKTFNNNMRGKAEGKTINLDCSKYIETNCTFFLFVQDNGNICIYRGTDPNKIINRTAIWCSNTSNKTQEVNNEWRSSKGKFGRNYMKMGESLALGEWIGSNNGRVKLQMENNGNLIIYTTTIKSGCSRRSGKMYGNFDNVNAVYRLNNIGNIDSLGKISYIDDDSKLRAYPDSMLGKSNEYILYQNFDSNGNTIKSLNVNKINDCMVECNNDDSCNGFSYQKDSKVCNLKDNNMFPKSSRQYNKNFVLGLRKPTIISNDTCSKKVINVDTIRYDNYVQGPMMTSSFECNENVLSGEKKERLTKLNSELGILGDKIANKMTEMYTKDNKIYEKMNMNSSEFKGAIEEYKNTNKKIQEYVKENSLDIVEGMKTMNDINGMLTNSDIIVLQENYNYMLWSILALGLMTITINIVRK
jgi:hypothetical protein